MLKFYIGIVAGIAMGMLAVLWAALVEDNFYFFLLNVITLLPLFYGSQFLADRLDNDDDT